MRVRARCAAGHGALAELEFLVVTAGIGRWKGSRSELKAGDQAVGIWRRYRRSTSSAVARADFTPSPLTQKVTSFHRGYILGYVGALSDPSHCAWRGTRRGEQSRKLHSMQLQGTDSIWLTQQSTPSYWLSPRNITTQHRCARRPHEQSRSPRNNRNRCPRTDRRCLCNYSRGVGMTDSKRVTENADEDFRGVAETRASVF
jgi:hypothetical protein